MAYASVRTKISHANGKPKNVFEAIVTYGHDEDYKPKPSKPTDAAPGTDEKIAVLRKRVEDGEELFNKKDRWHYEDQTAPIRPYDRVYPFQAKCVGRPGTRRAVT